MELLPTCAIWGKHWIGTSHCDNTAAVSVINSGYSRVPTGQVPNGISSSVGTS